MKEDKKVTTALAAAELNATEMAVREYFKDIPVMVQIAKCESHFRHTLADGSILRGKVDAADLGVMQINTRYHAARAATLGLDLHLLEDNLEYARDLYEAQGTVPWNSSAPCWKRTLAQA
ncbi:hypothetical protein HY416_01440 [Candidatus Kaiserbacteria bacterium]|nr:hypothetical protein [Candidatus Kaiserbacteria bacterium]